MKVTKKNNKKQKTDTNVCSCAQILSEFILICYTGSILQIVRQLDNLVSQKYRIVNFKRWLNIICIKKVFWKYLYARRIQSTSSYNACRSMHTTPRSRPANELTYINLHKKFALYHVYELSAKDFKNYGHTREAVN